MIADLRWPWIAMLLVAGGLTGCDEATLSQFDGTQPKSKEPPKKKVVKSGKKQPVKTQPEQKRRQPIASHARDLEKSWEASRVASLQTGRAEDVAIRQIGAAVKASLDVGPTLVVWLIDRTPSASKIVNDGVGAAKSLYDSPEIREALAGNEQNLLTAVVMFDEKVEFKLDPPTSDVTQVRAALDGFAAAGQGPEMTFTAIQAALEKYLPLRRQERRELMFVVLTDEAGDDQNKVDSLVDIVKKNAIPIYVVGTPAPWGQTNPFLTSGAKPTDANDDTYPKHGPETMLSERVNIHMTGSSGGYRPSQGSVLVDSGFGPFALERLCRASGGKFIALRPEAGGEGMFTFGGSGMGNRFWPTGAEMRFDPEVVSRYTPEYVSEADYQALLGKSKTRQALVAAAKMEPVNIDAIPSQRFQKSNEAQMARQLNTAQQFAARHSPKVDQLHGVLSGGEGDRDQLTTPRLQAEFDLAMGQTLAAKVRLDGYNAMLAALKRGKNFEKPNSREWQLEVGDKIETGSAIQKMAEKSTMYLKRVVADHPGTPWATLAEEDLKTPLGWEWKEN